jgi:hypothetical protein
MFNFENTETSNLLTKDYILSKVSAREIFKYYFGDFKIASIYSCPFRKDKNPSFGFLISKEGEIFARDFASKQTYDIVRFVSELYSLSFKDALEKIANDFNIIRTNSFLFDNIKSKKIYNVDEYKKEKLIQIKPREYTKEDLLFFKKIHINKKELIENNIYSWESAWVNKTELYNNEQLRFAIYEKDLELKKEYFKLYQPYANKGKWYNNIPIGHPFGINDLPFLSDTLIISKSFKERIILKKFFTDVIATQNESLNAVLDIIDITKNYKRIVVIWDSDKPGVEACIKVTKKYGWDYWNVPNYLLKNNIKDIAEYVEKFGLNPLEKRLIENKIL